MWGLHSQKTSAVQHRISSNIHCGPTQEATRLPIEVALISCGRGAPNASLCEF